MEVVEVLDIARSKRPTAGVGARRIRRKCCWRCCSTAMPRGFSQPEDRAGDLRADSGGVPQRGGTHPDHDSINTFRLRFLSQLEALFVQC